MKKKGLKKEAVLVKNVNKPVEKVQEANNSLPLRFIIGLIIRG